jgi:Fe2+ transport system protein FeoA
MSTRIPYPEQEIISGQQATINYLKMQKVLGRFYLNQFFELLAKQRRSGRFLEIGSGPGYQTAEVARRYPILIHKQDDSPQPPVQNAVKQLSELDAGQVGLIVSVEADSPGSSQKLVTMGILPNSVVRMMNRYAHYIIFKVDDRKFAAERAVGERILVQTI